MLHHVTRPPLVEFPRTLRTLEHLIWSWDTRVGACTGIQGQLGHRVSWDTRPVETQGQLGHTASWDTGWDTRVGTCTRIQGQLGHRASWDTGPVGTQGQLGHTDPPSVAISRYGFEAFE